MKKHKALFYIVTIALQFLLVFCYLRLFDQFWLIVVLFIFFVVVGISVKLTNENYTPLQKALAWGFLFGTITSIVIIASFFMYVILTWTA